MRHRVLTDPKGVVMRTILLSALLILAPLAQAYADYMLTVPRQVATEIARRLRPGMLVILHCPTCGYPGNFGIVEVRRIKAVAVIAAKDTEFKDVYQADDFLVRIFGAPVLTRRTPTKGVEMPRIAAGPCLDVNLVRDVRDSQFIDLAFNYHYVQGAQRGAFTLAAKAFNEPDLTTGLPDLVQLDDASMTVIEGCLT